MAFMDSLLRRNGNSEAPSSESSPEQALGHTEPASDPAEIPPRIGPPLGASGRANFYGLPQTDERNPLLVGPRGLALLDEMYRTDPHVRRLVLAAWTPIQSGTLSIEPYGGDNASDQDRQIAECVEWALTKHMSPNLFEHLGSLGPLLLRAGFCPFEQIWAPCDYEGKTLLLPRKLDVRLPRTIWRWWQDDFGELTHIGQMLPNKPDVVIPATELTYYRLAPEGDNWMGTSLLRHAYKPWLMKDRLERIAVIGEERKAVGVPIVYPPTNADPETRNEMERTLASLHVSEVAYLIMPGPRADHAPEGEGWDHDVIKFDSSSGESIQRVLEYHQQAIAGSFLEDFLELGHHQVGARATAQVQQDPFLTAVEGLASFVLPPLDRLIERIVALNWDTAQGAPTLKVTLHDQASLSEVATYVQQLVSAGAMQADPELEDWLRERADLPPANADLRAEAQAQDAQDRELAVKQRQAQIAGANQPKPGGDEPPPKAKPPRTLDASVTAKWWEQLFSQDRLREALDGARASVESAAGPQALTAARKLANQAFNGQALPDQPPQDLIDALTAEYERLYHLGHDTVVQELAKQRAALGTQLDARDVFGAVGARLARARARGQHSARNVVSAVTQRLRRDQVHALKTGAALQTAAERAASGALHVEALANASAQINDGRADAAAASSDVVGAYYTSVLDNRTCDPCATADDGNLMAPDEAISVGPPNPECEGQDRCRCALVWVLSSDPAALGAVTG